MLALYVCGVIATLLCTVIGPGSPGAMSKGDWLLMLAVSLLWPVAIPLAVILFFCKPKP